jgi:hypothetical protein
MADEKPQYRVEIFRSAHITTAYTNKLADAVAKFRLMRADPAYKGIPMRLVQTIVLMNEESEDHANS